MSSPALVLRARVPRLAGADLALECWSADQKSDVLEKVLGRQVTIRTS